MTRRTAHLGPPGTFSEEAAIRYDAGAELLPLATIAEVFEAVSSGLAERGVVPFESTLGGPVPATAELLAERTGVEGLRRDRPADRPLPGVPQRRHRVGRQGGVLASAGAGRVPGLPRAQSAARRAAGLRQHRSGPGRYGAQRATGRRHLLAASGRGQGRDYRQPNPGPPRQQHPVHRSGPFPLSGLTGGSRRKQAFRIVPSPSMGAKCTTRLGWG